MMWRASGVEGAARDSGGVGADGVFVDVVGLSFDAGADVLESVLHADPQPFV